MSSLQFINGLETCNSSKNYDNLFHHEYSYTKPKSDNETSDIDSF